jgi:hypothetical protein
MEAVLSMIDEFYFGSPNTKDVYCRYMSVENYKIIPIMHKGIKDFRREKKFSRKLKLLYMGQILPYKGFCLLKNGNGCTRYENEFAQGCAVGGLEQGEEYFGGEVCAGYLFLSYSNAPQTPTIRHLGFCQDSHRICRIYRQNRLHP